MHRRTFLRTGATATAATMLRAHATATSDASRAPVLPPSIDTHIHLYDPARPAGVPWPPPTDTVLYRPHLAPDFRTASRQQNVVGVIVVEASDWVEDNQWLLDLARDDTTVVGIVGHLQPGRPGFADNLRRFTANPLFRGLRLRAAYLKQLADPAVAADLRRVAAANLSLDLLGGAAILDPALRLARDLPSLPLIIDHLPFKDWDGNISALRTALAGIAAQPNLYLKVSEVVRWRAGQPVTDPEFYRPVLAALLDLVGPDRVIFGSNWPVSNKVAPYATVHQVVADFFSGQDRTTAEKYFWRNSLAAYRWIRRGVAADLH